MNLRYVHWLLLVIILLTACATPQPDTAAVTPNLPNHTPLPLLGTPTSLPETPTSVGTLPDQSQLLDAAWYRATLIKTVDLWNGGLDGKAGMGAYNDAFNGFFHVNLDQQWQPLPMERTTTIAQSRGIYMNVEAYRAAGEADGQRFLQAARTGADFLLESFWDDDEGGFYWEVDLIGRRRSSDKHSYGNVHALFALAHVYNITGDDRYLEAALAQVEVLTTRFLDPDYPLAIMPGFSRDFTRVVGVKNIDPFTHYFEALLAVYDITTGDEQAAIADLITAHGDFLVDHLYNDQEGFDDRGYVAYNYDFDWQPSQEPYSRSTQWSGAQHASPPHGMELAYLLSRAVERGFPERWLETAEKMMRFAHEYTFDPTTGGLLYEISDYQGQPISDNPDNDYIVWWAQSEAARAYMHFTIVREWPYTTSFEAATTLIHTHLTDPDYGGWFPQLRISDLQPDRLDKGNVWKVNYHYTMLFAEALRLGEDYS